MVDKFSGFYIVIEPLCGYHYLNSTTLFGTVLLFLQNKPIHTGLKTY